MLAILWVSFVVGGPYIYLGWKHFDKYGHINVAAQALILFLLINVLICFWELCLAYRYKHINAVQTKRVKDAYWAEKNAAKRDPIILFKVNLSVFFVLPLFCITNVPVIFMTSLRRRIFVCYLLL